MSRLLTAIEAALFGAQDSDYVLDHVDIKQTDEQREWHRKALQEARRRHGRDFTWGARLDLRSK